MDETEDSGLVNALSKAKRACIRVRWVLICVDVYKRQAAENPYVAVVACDMVFASARLVVAEALACTRAEPTWWRRPTSTASSRCTPCTDVYKRQQLGIDYVCGTSLVAEDVFSKIVSGHGSHIDTCLLYTSRCV